MALALVILLGPGARVAQGEEALLALDLADEIVERSVHRFSLDVSEQRMLFWGDDGRRGAELWITDGSADGTELWTEVCPGLCRDDEPFERLESELVFDGQRAFFVANDDLHGFELWTADGSREGTRLVADLCPGLCDAGIEGLTQIGGRLFFRAEVDGRGSEPWVSDGTAEGTSPLGDLRPGSRDSVPMNFQPFGDRIAFSAFTDENGVEWWTTDGTAEGTRRETDLCPGSCFVSFTGVAAFSGAILFSGRSSVEEHLYRWDPGSEPRVLATICESGCSYDNPRFFPAGDDLLFAKAGRLWETDGTVSGTRPLLDLPEEFWQVDEAVELSGGTRLLIGDLEGVRSALYRIEAGGLVGPLLEVPANLDLEKLGEGATVILANASGDTVRIWGSDGTAAGTRILDELPTESTFSTFVHRLMPVGDRVVFGARTNADFLGTELWATDGQPGGARRVLGVRELAADGDPADATAIGSRVVFTARGALRQHERDLWSIDDFGIASQLLDEASASDLAAVELPEGERVFFTSDRDATRKAPWITDGTPEGTRALRVPGEASFSYGREPVTLNGDLYFLADQGSGQKIWRSDGTPGGIELVVDLYPDWPNIHESCPVCSPPILAGPIFPRELHVFRGGGSRRLVFVGGAETSGAELWQSDGTAEGTALVTDLYPGDVGSEPENLLPAGDFLLFTADDGTGRALWSWPGFGSPQRLREVGEMVATASTDDLALWIELRDGRFFLEVFGPDGSGTVFEFPLDTVPDRELVVRADRVYFAAADGSGSELWSGGLEPGAGAERLADLWPGVRGSTPQGLRAHGGHLYFSADDGSHGRELWSLDLEAGEPEPMLLADVAPGALGSSPGSLALARSERPELQGGLLFFAATDEASGRELWVLPVDPGAADCRGAGIFHCLQDGRFRVSARLRDPFSGAVRRAVPLSATADSGSFWFFGPDNLELVVKVVDGRESNEAFWLFYGALSDVEYWVDVEDLESGRSRTYYNPPGTYCGLADIDTFRTSEGFSESFHGANAPSTPEAPTSKTNEGSACEVSDEVLCLRDRFEVRVQWRDHSQGEGNGQALPFTSESGLFWFFGPDNLELAVKMLDGRSSNGHFWFFFGALSDVEYSVHVLDLETGAERTYQNPAGTLCGQADIQAFPGG